MSPIAAFFLGVLLGGGGAVYLIGRATAIYARRKWARLLENNAPYYEGVLNGYHDCQSFLDEAETEADFRKALQEYITKAAERHARLTGYMVDGAESRAKTDADEELAD